MATSVRHRYRKTTTTHKRKSKAKVSPPGPPPTRRPPPQIRRLDTSKVGFGDLPAELRNQIYELALTPSSGAAIRIVQPSPREAGRDIALGLLASCKAVRIEAWSFFYERNEFRIDCVDVWSNSHSQNEYSHSVWCDHTVFKGYDSTPNKYPEPVRSYQQDLDKFISSTNCKLGLQSVRTISLAFHHEHKLSKDKDGKILSFPENAEAVVALKLLSKSPFFSVEINDALSAKCLRPADKTKIIEMVEEYMRFTIDPLSGARKMCKTIMIDFCERSYQSCRHL